MPDDYVIAENKICVKAIGFSLGTGKVHDTNGNRTKRSTNWRQICAPVPPGSVGTIEMEVDNEESMIYWKF